MNQTLRSMYRSKHYTLKAPIGGLNLKNSSDSLLETEALEMDNYIPDFTAIKLRKGYKTHYKTPFLLETLMEYKASQSLSYLFGAGGGKILNVTTQFVPASSNKRTADEEIQNRIEQDTCATGFQLSQWQWCQFKNRLFCVNGVDAPQTFIPDETGETVGSWQNLAFEGEGLILSKLVNVGISKQRLWFVEKGSLKVWYSASAGEVQGTLLPFDFSTVATKGGYLVHVGSWTKDGGEGMDDLTVFLTSEGEALIYTGINPNEADQWKLVGVYKLPRPIGNNCFLPYLGDLIVITEEGYVPLSKAILLMGANASTVAFSDKIQSLVLERARSGFSKYGWQGIIYPRGNYALFNVPVGNTFEQHVVMLFSGAWCRFKNLRAYSWCMMQNRLYFSNNDGVQLFDEGYSDNGAFISGRVRQAFSPLGVEGLKKVVLLNPKTKSSNKFSLVIYTDTDYASSNQSYSTVLGEEGESYWNTAPWSSFSKPSGSKWATLQGHIQSVWIGNLATGYCFSVVFQTKTKGTLIEWFGTGVRYEQGNGLI